MATPLLISGRNQRFWVFLGGCICIGTVGRATGCCATGLWTGLVGGKEPIMSSNATGAGRCWGCCGAVFGVITSLWKSMYKSITTIDCFCKVSGGRDYAVVFIFLMFYLSG